MYIVCIIPRSRLNPYMFDFCTIEGIWTSCTWQIDETEDQLSLSLSFCFSFSYMSQYIIHQKN